MAYDFDGVNDKIDHTNIAAINSAANLTVMCWTFIDTLATQQGFVSKGSGAVQLFGMGSGTVNTRFAVRTSGNPALLAETASGVLAATTWTHTGFAYNGAGATDADRMKGYINGSQVTFTYGFAIPATLGTNASGLLTGSDAFAATFADVKIANVKIWTVTLTDSEMAQEVWSYRPVKKSGLLLWAPYDYNGTAAADYSGNEFNGTITEAVLATGPPGVNYGTAAMWDARNKRSRRADIDPIRRLGPQVPLYERGV